jgi:uncharacterized membrane protein
LEDLVMKAATVGLGALMVACLIGCTNHSEPGGGPTKAEQVTLSGPDSTTIKQGETQTVTLHVERGKNFQQTVKLNAAAPSGVAATLAENAVKPSDKGDVSLKIAVGENAAVGDQVIQVTGTPDTGTPTTLPLKIKVAARADLPKLALSGPFLVTTIKQGETQTISITLKHHDKNSGDVALSVANVPKGVTAALTANTIKASDSGDIGLKVTADKTASLGEYALRINGTSTTATIDPVDVKIKIAAP